MKSSTIEPGTPSTIQTINRRLVLELLRQGKPVSKTDIARILGMTLTTAAHTVDYFLRIGLAQPLRSGESTGGRRPTLLGLNHKAGHVIALSIGAEMSAGLFDLGGKALVRLTETIVPGSGEIILTRASRLISQLVADISIPAERIWAIGISAPGITDPTLGAVSSAPIIGPGTWQLGQFFSTNFSVATLVENDVNAAALGERLLGAGRQLDDFIYILWGEGIGAGIVLQGNLYRGDGYAAGEIGYMPVDFSRSGDRFSSLESLTSNQAIRQLIFDAGRCLEGTSGCSAFGIDALLQMAKEGNPNQRQAADRVLQYMAMGTANLCTALAPSAIIVGGPNVSEDFLSALKTRMKGMTPKVPPLLCSVLGEDASLVGAASLAINHVLDRAYDDYFSATSNFSAEMVIKETSV